MYCNTTLLFSLYFIRSGGNTITMKAAKGSITFSKPLYPEWIFIPFRFMQFGDHIMLWHKPILHDPMVLCLTSRRIRLSVATWQNKTACKQVQMCNLILCFKFSDFLCSLKYKHSESVIRKSPVSVLWTPSGVHFFPLATTEHGKAP